ncbi:MAG: transporter, ATP-binding protein [Parcubacteria group bacterium]|nr:transporter, ATP-binding protein [Parcubacteria group bacterium]
MNEPIITVTGLSKKYNITHQRGGYIALRDIIANAFRNPFRFLKSKAKSMIGRETQEEFWALKGIDFEVMKGEAIGIIGSNGAGKSTLLKILSKITPPTEGEVVLRGRVASLLEVGTGFHPELSGRENILLNGAILGMTRKEIASKFDDIVKFSGVEKFIDTPVKRYSSGMYVRLAFSVAAHMEPDILIVDEVLAVGDAEFQKKCLGKMDEVTQTAHRTVLFVSHNMSAIQKLCKRTILLEHGKVKMIGKTDEVIAAYLESNPLTQEGSLKTRKDRRGEGNIKLSSFFVENEKGERVNNIFSGGLYTLCFGYETKDGREAHDLSVASAITGPDNAPLSLNWSRYTNEDKNTAPAKGIIRCEIRQKFPFAPGLYHISANLFSGETIQDYIKNLGVFEVQEGNFYGTGADIKHSPILLEQHWSIKEE